MLHQSRFSPRSETPVAATAASQSGATGCGTSATHGVAARSTQPSERAPSVAQPSQTSQSPRPAVPHRRKEYLDGERRCEHAPVVTRAPPGRSTYSAARACGKCLLRRARACSPQRRRPGPAHAAAAAAGRGAAAAGGIPAASLNAAAACDGGGREHEPERGGSSAPRLKCPTGRTTTLQATCKTRRVNPFCATPL